MFITLNKLSRKFLLCILILNVGISCKKDDSPESENQIDKTPMWIQKSDFGGGIRYDAASFVINNNLYVGLGIEDNYEDDLWEYSPESDKWALRTWFPGGSRNNTVSFAISGFGYVGMGHSFEGTGLGNHTYYNDMWKYDPISNNWTEVAEFPGGEQTITTCFVIDNCVYFPGENQDYKFKLFEYNTDEDAWTEKNDIPPCLGYCDASFVIENKGYVLGSFTSGCMPKSLYQYDKETNSWVQKASLPVDTLWNVTALGYKNKGYVFCGAGIEKISPLTEKHIVYKNIWVYDPKIDSWEKMDSIYVGNGATGMIAESVDDKIIIGLGSDISDGGGPGNRCKDIWQFNPDGQ